MIILLITIMIRIKPECVELVMEKTAVGDWFLLYLLGQNIDHIVFKVVREMMIGGNSGGDLKQSFNIQIKLRISWEYDFLNAMTCPFMLFHSGWSNWNLNLLCSFCFRLPLAFKLYVMNIAMWNDGDHMNMISFGFAGCFPRAGQEAGLS